MKIKKSLPAHVEVVAKELRNEVNKIEPKYTPLSLKNKEKASIGHKIEVIAHLFRKALKK